MHKVLFILFYGILECVDFVYFSLICLLNSFTAISSIPVTPIVKKSRSMGLKPITKFFSKRCLPPEKAGLEDPSPQKSNGKEIYGNEITILNG